MTLRERAQVVELLRCAADLARVGKGCVLAAAKRLDYDPFGGLVEAALNAWGPVAVPGVPDEHQLLEAAQRVEEGSWP